MAKAEASLELAEMRLRGLAPVAVAQLESLVTGATREAVRLGAARDLIDRSFCLASHRTHSGRVGHHGQTAVVVQR
jgi:hypothetical protein